MNKCKIIVSLLFSSLIAVNSFSQTVTIQFQQGLNGYGGVSDTYIQTGAPDNVLEGLFEWEVDGSDAGGFNYGVVRFADIFGAGPNQIPLGSTIVKAELTNFVSNSGGSSEASIIYNLLVNVDFPNASLNTVFDGDLAQPGVHYSESPSSENLHRGAGDTWTVDITALVQALSDGHPNNGFLFIPNEGTSNGFGFIASEAFDGAPTLIVESAIGNFSFQEGLNGYSGLQDAWIGNQDARFFTAHGTAGTLDIELDSPEDIEIGLIRFDNIFGSNTNQIPLGTEITKATLRVNVSDTGGDLIFVSEIKANSEIIAGIEINTFFDETTVTYENFISDGFLPQPGVDIEDQTVADFTPDTAGPLEIDVTDSLKKWSGGAQNLGWLFEPTGGGSVSLVSKEGALVTPLLTITYEGEAPPASIHDFMLY